MNLLSQETSPYLLQHADNPVHWRPWGAEALAEAQKLNRPILLSIGYAACHWCHVMAHESFENPQIAEVMNADFINIKVDREERPDLDAIYQAALAMTGEHGGWPLTMFLTPKGEPFFGGTYFPPVMRFGRPGFVDVLQSVALTWKERPEAVAHNVRALSDSLARLARGMGSATLTLEFLDQAAEKLISSVDMAYGGIGGAPKFPQASALEFLLRAHLRTKHPEYLKGVTITLDAICQGGIYDHLAGGFARYATDERWLAPHFEKMLYDNAQMIELLTLAWQATKSPLYRQRVEETVSWLLRDMTTAEGALAATVDADSEGEEGKYYVWDEFEIDALLSEDSQLFKSAYDVRPRGNWEGHNILNRLEDKSPNDEKSEKILKACRDKLLAVRSKRIPPGRDDKILADWNGMAIAALAFAGEVFARPEWTTAAKNIFHAVTKLLQKDDGLLCHSGRAGRRMDAAMLDDYAQMARSGLALYEASGEKSYLTSAKRWADIAIRQYWDQDNDGFFFSADTATDVIIRTKSQHDSATPSGNAAMAQAMARLYHLTGEDRWRDWAEKTIYAACGDIARHYPYMGAMLNAFEILSCAATIVLTGGNDDQRAKLAEAVHSLCLPNRIFLRVEDGAAFSSNLSANHPAFGKTAQGAKAAAYVCRDFSCSAPLTEPSALQAYLEGR